jgi:hypothetical protein
LRCSRDGIGERADERHLSLEVVGLQGEAKVTHPQRSDAARSAHRVRRRPAPRGHSRIHRVGVVDDLRHAVARAELLHPLTVHADLCIRPEEPEGVRATEPEAVAQPRPVAARGGQGRLSVDTLRRKDDELGRGAEASLFGTASREDVDDGVHRARAVHDGAGAEQDLDVVYRLERHTEALLQDAVRGVLGSSSRDHRRG